MKFCNQIHLKRLCFLFIFCALLLFWSLPLYSQTLSFTAIPDQNSARLQQRFSKVAAYLSQKLGVPVTYIPVKSYSASVAAFKNNQVQLAWFGGLSGVKARLRLPGAQAIAQGLEDPQFLTYFIAHQQTGLPFSQNFPLEMAGYSFTFGSKGSTSGRLMPEYYLRKFFKKTPREIFKRVGFSGDHSKTIALVQSGSYSVGAVNYKVWETELQSGKIDTKKVHVIWKTPPYPDYNWSIRGDVEKTFGAGFIKKVQKALVQMKDPDLLQSFPRTRFIPANNAQFQPILDVSKEIGIIRR